MSFLEQLFSNFIESPSVQKLLDALIEMPSLQQLLDDIIEEYKGIYSYWNGVYLWGYSTQNLVFNEEVSNKLIEFVRSDKCCFANELKNKLRDNVSFLLLLRKQCDVWEETLEEIEKNISDLMVSFEQNNGESLLIMEEILRMSRMRKQYNSYLTRSRIQIDYISQECYPEIVKGLKEIDIRLFLFETIYPLPVETTYTFPAILV